MPDTESLIHQAARKLAEKTLAAASAAANEAEFRIPFQALHAATAAAETENLTRLEAENLELAASYWGLEKSEVTDIKASLEELA